MDWHRQAIKPLWLAIASTAFITSALVGAEAPPRPRSVPHNQDAPPGPPLSPAEAIAKMTVPAGFRVELVAAEPDLVNPVAMTFDERGRVWVTESLEYPRLEAGAGRDRVKILADTDRDGTADKFTIFAEGLNIPSGIAVGHGGVWVANSPDLLFLQDTDGDDRADRREVVLTGFGRADTHELPNSLTWGPDGWLYGLNGVFNRSRIEHQGKTHDFTCALWRLHPRTRAFELFAEGTSNPWGIAWDPAGSAFVSACVIDHLWHLTESGYYHRQGGPYPPHTWKIESIVGHRHQKAAYCGIHYFDSDAYPPQYRDRLYMGNIHGAAINVDSLRRDGSTYRGDGEPDFLSAHDAWFMPIVQKTGPDGCLYVLDWYDRYHCYQDARRDPEGIDRLKGRLYRIRYGDAPRADEFDLAAESDEQLTARLASPNVYFRDVAQRILSERQSVAAAPRLQAVVLDDTASHKTRMHALWSLLGAGDLPVEFHLQLLGHSDATLRAWAVRAAGDASQVDPRLIGRLVELFADSSPDVRLQLAIAAQKVSGLEPREVLVDVLSRSGDDPLIPQIVWQNLYPLLDEHETAVAQVFRRYQSLPAGVAQIAPRTIDYWLASQPARVEAVVAVLEVLLDERGSSGAAAECLDKIAERVENGTLSSAASAQLRDAIAPRLTRVLAATPNTSLFASAACLSTLWGDATGLQRARELVEDANQPDARRLQALAALVAAAEQEAFPLVRRLLASPNASAGFRRRLIFAIGETENQQVADLLLAAYPQLEPEVQPVAIETLTQRPGWGKVLLTAIERKSISRDVLNVNQVRRLLKYPDNELTEGIRAAWGSLRTERSPQREQVIGQVRAMLATTPADPQSGVAIFQKACAQCHKIYGQGAEVGPDLTLNGRNSWEQLLSNVLDPSLVIGADYQARVLTTSDGRSFTGLLVEDAAEQVTLKLQGGKTEVIARADIDEMETISLSLMPEGLERQLSSQELADLMAYLALDRPPEDPAGRLLDGAPVVGK